MTRHLKFDAVDKAALRALQAHYTGFTISDNKAVITGEMEITVVRPTNDQFCITVTFPNNEDLTVGIGREQVLQMLGVDES